jgi:uncharacterized repeat protein (TIGR03803 family)
LFLASDGNLYGTTDNGGNFGQGTVFRMTTPGGAIKILHHFNGTDGSRPDGPLIQGTDGKLYGTTVTGGANGSGEVFQMTLSGTFKVIFSFDAFTDPDQICNNDGGNPAAGLMLAADGFFYGVTFNGGANCLGTIFRVSNTGSFGKLFDFAGSGGAVSGANPTTTLKLHTNGIIYGLTESGGGPTNQGSYFSLSPSNNLIHILIVEGPIFVLPGQPVEIFGNNLTHVANVYFGSGAAQFQIGSDTFLRATVPSSAIDAPISAVFDTGLQVETLMSVHILPIITNLDPTSGQVGMQVGIVGGGFSGAKKVTFGGVKATSFTVVTPSLIRAIVPAGAVTGKVAVTTPNGKAMSKQIFTVN